MEEARAATRAVLLLPFLRAGSPSTACPTLCKCPAMLGAGAQAQAPGRGRGTARCLALARPSTSRPSAESCHRLSPRCPSAPPGLCWLQDRGAWQHHLEPSPAPSLINAHGAFVLIALHVFSASTKHLRGDSVPLTLQPRYRGLQPTTGDGEGRSSLDLRGGLGVLGRKGLRTVPAVPGPGCESQGPMKRRCQLTLGRGRRTAEPAKPRPEQFSHCCRQVSTILLLQAGKAPCRAAPGWPTQHLSQWDAVMPGCAAAPWSCQRGAEPVPHGARRGASQGQALPRCCQVLAEEQRGLAAPYPPSGSPSLPVPVWLPRRQRPVPRLVQAAFPCSWRPVAVPNWVPAQRGSAVPSSPGHLQEGSRSSQKGPAQL